MLVGEAGAELLGDWRREHIQNGIRYYGISTLMGAGIELLGDWRREHIQNGIRYYKICGIELGLYSLK